MPDRAVVMSAPEKTRQNGKVVKVGAPVRPLRVKLGDVVVDAVRIKDARYEASEGDVVMTVPLSNGTYLVLGPESGG